MLSSLFVSQFAFATERARVVDVNEKMEERMVSSEKCYPVTEQKEIHSGNATAGTILGGIVGGVVGHQVGKGRGNDVATAAGAVIGALSGRELAGDDTPRYEERTVQKCRPVERIENRIVGYDVTYEYGGRTYQTVMRNRPGRTIPVNVVVQPLED